MFDWIIDVIGWTIRAFFYQLFCTLLEKIFYWPGWLLLRLLTFGRYPPQDGGQHNRFAVGLFAITLALSVPLLYSLIA